MATKMLTSGAVQFKGAMIELGKPAMVNGRRCVPFLAWVRPEDTQIRVKWPETYMPSDFSDRFGRQVQIEGLGA